VKRISVAVIDDHAVVRMGLKYALAALKDMAFAGELSDGEGAAEFVRRLAPDVVLLDIRMSGKDGIAALGEILAARPETKVVMLTTSTAAEDVFRSLESGAKGYVLKDRSPQSIVDAIREVAAGGTYVPKDVREIYVARRRAPELTPREGEALRLLAKGLSNREIGTALGISEDGAKIHLKHVFWKLDAKDRVEAVAIALRRGLVVAE